MITLSFSKEEVDQLVGLLDLATKAGGLQIAQAALPLASKLDMARRAAAAEAPANVVPLEKPNSSAS
jgi:hypothetical protein